MEGVVADGAGRWLDALRGAQEWLNRTYPTAAVATPGTVAVAPARDVNAPVSRNDPLYREFLELAREPAEGCPAALTLQR